jgi:hypothetical protein
MPLWFYRSNIWLAGTIFTRTSFRGNASMALSSARTFAGVPWVS